MIATRGLPEVRIHDLGRLLQILEKDGLDLPENSLQLDELTIYAVPMRYDELLDAEPLDREATIGLIEEVGAWAKRSVGAVDS